MLTVLLQGIQIFLSMFEVWLCYQLLYCTLLEKEYLNLKEKIIIWANIIVWGILVSWNRNIIFFSHGVFILGLILTGICAAYIIKKSKRLIVSLLVISYSLTALLDFLFLFLSMVVLDYPTTQAIYDGVSWLKLPIFLLSRVIMLICLLLLKKRGELFLKNILEYRKLLYIISIILVILLRRYQLVMCRMVFGRIPYNGIDSGVSLLLLMVIILSGWGLYVKSLILQKENQFLMSKDELMLQNYKNLMMNMEANKQRVHDIKHQLAVLQGYARDGEYEKFCQYLSEIDGDFYKFENKVWTGHRILDFILNLKKEAAEQKEIDFEICVTALMETSLSDGDISILVGNLLDNAIEACEQIQDGMRWVLFKLKKRQHSLFIEISNSLGTVPRIKDGELLTSKKDKRLHGYGLKSVKRIVQKYDGVFSFSVEADVFKVKISFMK